MPFTHVLRNETIREYSLPHFKISHFKIAFTENTIKLLGAVRLAVSRSLLTMKHNWDEDSYVYRHKDNSLKQQKPSIVISRLKIFIVQSTMEKNSGSLGKRFLGNSLFFPQVIISRLKMGFFFPISSDLLVE